MESPFSGSPRPVRPFWIHCSVETVVVERFMRRNARFPLVFGSPELEMRGFPSFLVALNSKCAAEALAFGNGSCQNLSDLPSLWQTLKRQTYQICHRCGNPKRQIHQISHRCGNPKRQMYQISHPFGNSKRQMYQILAFSITGNAKFFDKPYNLGTV
jgi:hypothetical protein